MSVVALLVLGLGCTASALEVVWTAADNSYSVVHNGSPLFGATGGLAAFANGGWSSVKAGTMKLASKQPITGTDPILGKYSGVALSWTLGAANTPFVTTSRNYDDGLTVTFEQSWPKGATGTSLVAHNASGAKSNQEVIANFPAFTDTLLPNTLSWSGSFVGPQQNSGQRVTGPQGGPTVFFDRSDPKLETVVVLSPLDNFKASSAGPGTTFDGTTPAFAPGTAGTITTIPAGYAATWVLRAGSGRGITAAIGEWGTMLRTVHKTYRVPDVTLQKIGYQTDNGAAYVFCRPGAPYKDCNALLIDELKQLKAAGVPMGYLSFQGAGASTMTAPIPISRDDIARTELRHSEESESTEAGAIVAVGGPGPLPPHPSIPPSAPWCVNEWGPDLNMTQRSHGVFPMDEAAFQRALGVPLQLYAPYFCPESKYFQRNNPASQWVGVTSDTTLPGCSYYGFQDATPQESRKFYDWFFAKGKAVGMASFEPDFMNQNYNCVPDFIESTSNSDMWQHGMTDAALAANLTVQWCYAAPTDVLNSLTMPALTNFRVSNDFCYGHSWDIGVSSLIVWAVGAFPSKDTLWTTDNGRFAVPGCNWSPDHETPAAALHVVLALMSTGPVGISDKVGMTNVELAKRTIAADGTLLKPSKAITSVDSALAAGTGLLSTKDKDIAEDGDAPKGYVYHTYTGETLAAPTSWIFVSFKMTADWAIAVLDFYPALVPGGAVVWRAFGSGATCADGSVASDCVVAGGLDSAVLVAPQSDHSNVTGGTDYSPTVATVWQACPGGTGAVLLGDLTKFVALSPDRFKNVRCSGGGVSYDVVGTPGEVVQVTSLTSTGASGKVVVKAVTIPGTGVAAVAAP